MYERHGKKQEEMNLADDADDAIDDSEGSIEAEERVEGSRIIAGTVDFKVKNLFSL